MIEEDEKWIRLFRYTLVYNISQTIGLEHQADVEAEVERHRQATVVPQSPEKDLVEKLEKIGRVFEASAKDLGFEWREGGDSAVCVSDSVLGKPDYIQIPRKEEFLLLGEWAKVRAHENIHATKWVCGRAKYDVRGDEKYSYEELVAEFGSVNLVEQFGLLPYCAPIENTAAYIQGWAEKLQKDPNVLIFASRAAMKAANVVVNGKAVLNSQEVYPGRQTTVSAPVGEIIVEPIPSSETASDDVLGREPEEPKTALQVEYRAINAEGILIERFIVAFANPNSVADEEFFEQIYSEENPDMKFNPAQIGLPGNADAVEYDLTFETVGEVVTDQLEGRTVEEFASSWTQAQHQGWKPVVEKPIFQAEVVNEGKSQNAQPQQETLFDLPLSAPRRGKRVGTGI